MSTRDRQGSGAPAIARWTLLAVATVLAASGLHAQTTGLTATRPADATGALARYVAKPDDTFSWELRTHFRAKGADAIELLLQSQTWQGVAWKHQVDLDALADDTLRHRRLCELNVREQVRNISQCTSVQEAWERGQQLEVHGWIYDLKDGLLHDLQVSMNGDLGGA